MTTTNFLDDFFGYYNRDWSKRSENVGRSFTYGTCFYDGVKEGHLDLGELEWEINDYIRNDSGCKDEWLDYLDDKVKIELVDFSLLSELIDSKIEEAQEEQQEELFDELDDEKYKTREELENRVADLLEDYEYIDKSLGNVCDDYEDDRGIDYQEQLFEELDSFEFANKFEVLSAINDYYKGEHEENASYEELVKYGEEAEGYIANRNLEFNEEENE